MDLIIALRLAYICILGWSLLLRFTRCRSCMRAEDVVRTIFTKEDLPRIRNLCEAVGYEWPPKIDPPQVCSRRVLCVLIPPYSAGCRTSQQLSTRDVPAVLH